MKTSLQLILALAWLPLIAGFAEPPATAHSTNANNHPYPKAGTGVYLMYMGYIGNMAVDITFEIDSSIGFQYAVAMGANRAANTHPTMALFYKFSNPGQVIYYNYHSHQSQILTSAGAASDAGGPDVTFAGNETVNTYPCTHLVQKSGETKDDYWMSTSVPGFAALVNKLNSINPELVVANINGTIFNWGGLVKLVRSDKKGGTFNLELKIINTKMQIPASDFDVPTN